MLPAVAFHGIASGVTHLYVRNIFVSSELSVVSIVNSPFTADHSHSSVQECDATVDATCNIARYIKILAQQKTFLVQQQFFLNFRLQKHFEVIQINITAWRLLEIILI